jgi:hypothetical protein
LGREDRARLGRITDGERRSAAGIVGGSLEPVFLRRGGRLGAEREEPRAELGGEPEGAGRRVGIVSRRILGWALGLRLVLRLRVVVGDAEGFFLPSGARAGRR